MVNAYLGTRYTEKWCLRQELNLLRYALQAYALPVELRGQILCRKINGDSSRIRTCIHWVAASCLNLLTILSYYTSISIALVIKMAFAERLELSFTAPETVVLPVRRSENKVE